MKRLPPVSMEQLKARSPDWGSLLLQEPLSMNERAILFLMSVLNGFEEPQGPTGPSMRPRKSRSPDGLWRSCCKMSGTTRGRWHRKLWRSLHQKWSFSPKPATRMPSTGSSRSRPKPYGNFSMTSKRSSAEHNYIYERRRRCEQTGYHKHAEIAAKDHA